MSGSTFGIGNGYGYKGDTVTELQEYAASRLQAQIQEVGYQIIEFIPFDEYSNWIDGLPKMSGTNLLAAMQDKLTNLETEECTCIDPERTCPACRHAAYRQWYLRQESVDGHLEAQYEQQFETDF